MSLQSNQIEAICSGELSLTIHIHEWNNLKKIVNKKLKR